MHNRPTSPHLQIYNIFSKEMTSGPSILHRMTGIGLTIGLLYVVVWLLSAAMGEAAYNTFIKFITSWFGYLSLVGFSLCLFYHMTNGFRFLMFSLGYLLTKKQVFISGWLAVAIALFLFVTTWVYIIFVYIK